MQTKEYRTVDKSAWPRGEWDTEPDKKQWTDEATGLPCLIVRSSLGHLCGYVGVHEGHPLFEKGYESSDISVHGGITFADFCKPHHTEAEGICHAVESGENDRAWWLGFDCAHSGDRTSLAIESLFGRNYDESYRNFSFVERQCRELAQQLAGMVPA